jgi:hypothetical protein
MAGNFTNLMYDNDAYQEKVNRSTGPLKYYTDANYAVNCRKCFPPYGPIGGQVASDAVGEQIDVESILRGYSKIHSKSNQQQIPDSLFGYKTRTNPDCDDALETEYTRYTYPAYDIRGLNVPDLNLGYPLHDPQCQIFENFAVNTRLQAKDNHRAIWQIPMNQRDLLPTERLGKVKNCRVGLNCDYAPYNR